MRKEDWFVILGKCMMGKGKKRGWEKMIVERGRGGKVLKVI